LKNTIKAGLVIALISGCAAVSIDLPAISETATGEHDSGRVVWHDLITTTPDASRRFYEELFGWTFESPEIDLGFGGTDSYMLIRHDGRLIGGMVDANSMNAETNISQWITVMSVDDINTAVSNLEKGGGTILTPPTVLASRGTLAVVHDPSGAIFAMVQTIAGDPPPAERLANDFLWDELWTIDVEDHTQFYSFVFGYEKEDRELGASAKTYRVLNQQGAPQVGIMANPFPGERPVWVNYLRVDDPAAITARVEELGGSILLPTQDRDIGGKVALIAGPSGAGIALQTWPLDGAQQ
jgi:predicted enzyme related to lactoylglutathione lyase